MKQLSSRDLEQISAYLDHQLSQADAARLASRIQAEPELRSVYAELRQSRALLRKLPMRRAPRNFMLTPKTIGIKPPLPRAFPIFRLASALAAVMFFLGYALNLSAPLSASMRAAAPLADNAPPAAAQMLVAPTEVPQAFAPKVVATQAVLPSQQNSLAATATPEITTLAVPANGAASERSLEPPPTEPPALPVQPLWLFGLLGLAVVSGASAFLIRMRTDRNWSKAHTAGPVRLETHEMLWITLVVVAVLLLTAGIYWMTTGFSL